MFKFSFMSCIAPNWSFDRLVKTARELGYAGIEFRVGARQHHGIEPETSGCTLATKKRLLEEEGLEVSCLATSIMLVPRDEAEYRSELNSQITTLANLPAEIGAPLLRLSARTARGDGELEIVAHNLALAEEIASSKGIDVALETTAGFTSAQSVLAVVRRVNQRGIGILWDTYHTLRSGESLAESFNLVKPYLKHVHINHLPTHTRMLALSKPAPSTNLPELFSLLRESDYNGYVSGEWLGVSEPLAYNLLKTNRLLLDEAAGR